MPKILINERDYTSAGTPGSYDNYAVLITGYAARTPVLAKDATETKPADKIQPDENGVYEFFSKQEFLDTIGAAAVEKKSGEEIAEYHYGNKMAQELLSMGYPVVYKVINKISDMQSETFWEIFKDKASYDFRFVNHGLLESCYDAVEHTSLNDRIAKLKADIKKLEEIDIEASKTEQYKTDPTGACEVEFTRVTEEEGYVFSLGTGDEEYATYNQAMNETSGIAFALEHFKGKLDEHNEKFVTIDVFNNINEQIALLASSRGDCTALIELDEDIYCEAGSSNRPETLIISGIKGLSSKLSGKGEYCALTVPSVHYYVDGKKTNKLPGAFHYLACFKRSLDSGFAEWYAAAGYTRGVANAVIDHTSVKLGEIAINALEPRNIEDQESQPPFACNVIANFRGSYYLWGNRTAAPLGDAKGSEDNDLTAKHFLNIRQLCTTIKKQLYVACRRFTFDPNSDLLWIKFENAITPTLDRMKADQGIRDYRIIPVATDKKATLKAKLRIIPIEAVEDFDIEIALEDSFGGVAVTAV